MSFTKIDVSEAVLYLREVSKILLIFPYFFPILMTFAGDDHKVCGEL
jgi:hypothetical protein